MAEAMRDILAVPDKRARKLAGISMHQLRYWEETGLVRPSIRRTLSPRNTVRLYSFEDLIELVIVAELRRRPGISLQHIRAILGHLRQRQKYTAPLRELRFATYGPHIYVQHPDGSWSGDPRPEQLIFQQALMLDLVGERVSSLSERDPATAGKIVRRRGVHASEPVFAGTRIPVGAVQRYLQAGYEAQAIIEEYPSLTLADVEAARQSAAA
jgi:DNA-binding transcriptional MerR regulator